MELTFEEIEKLDFKTENIPNGLTVTEQYAYLSIKHLYRLYRADVISRQHATDQKKIIRKNFEKENELYQHYLDVIKEYANAIRSTEKFRVHINQMANQNSTPNIPELFLDACNCIADVTQDKVFLKYAKQLTEKMV